MIDAHALVKARELKGFSQPELARRAGCSQQLIGALEKGTTKSTKFLPKIAAALETDPGLLDSDWAGIAAPPQEPEKQSAILQVGDPYGPKDFGIYTAAEGGLGEILRSPEPVDWWPRPIEVARVTGAYGMYIVGTSMIPDFEPGQVAVINPHLPHIGGKPYIFYAETEDGSVRATVKRLRHQGSGLWHVTQHNPRVVRNTILPFPRTFGALLTVLLAGRIRHEPFKTPSHLSDNRHPGVHAIGVWLFK